MNKNSVLTCLVFSALLTMSFNLQAETVDHHHNENGAAMLKPDIPEIHHTTGTVTHVNAARGQIIIHHPPIDSLEWEEMTMPFPIVDRALLKDIKVGDKVKIDLMMPDDVATISKIEVIKE